MRSRLKVSKVRSYPRRVISSKSVILEITRRNPITLYQYFKI